MFDDDNTGMGKEQELTDALLRMMRVASKDYTFVDGTIVDVDEVQWTCDVLVKDHNSEATFSDVSLETQWNEAASVIFIPNKDSPCVICFRDGHKDRPQLFKVHSARVVWINPTEQIKLHEGANGGLPLVRPLVEHINTLEKNINELRNLIEGWVPQQGDGGASLKVALASWLSDTIEPTTEEQIANENIVQ